MNIILLGPQGSGKGTQAKLLCEKYGFFYFESGAYLRKIAQTNSEVKKFLEEGKLVPDRELTSYLTAFLDQESLYNDILFDGFPRTLEQYNFWKGWILDKEFKLDLVLILEISQEESIKRLSARRTDPVSSVVYNLVTDPPPADVDVNSLVQRDDDKPEAIKVRLDLYREMTTPLISELKKEIKVVEVDGERPVEAIFNDLVKVVDENNGHSN